MRDEPEFRWVLHGFSPETLSMVRLADYMKQLAKFLGEESSVHFDRIERNCVAVIARATPSAAGRIRAQVSLARSGKASQEVMRAYRQIDTMLAEDGANAVLKDTSSNLIRFPGTKPETPATVEVRDTGVVVGYLYMLFETNEGGYHARLRLDSGRMLHCSASGAIARKLREHLFNLVKVFGSGTWCRSDTGEWAVTQFEINDIVSVDGTPLRGIVDRLRDLAIDWGTDPLGDLYNVDNDGEANR